ncbi:MAG: peptidoglycan DD-metalloendopeptidase family protein [Ardenticatenaceae bacterium]|nr:peptidoglycan DD-metalloendopeptidase family protein [Ardenticatenaceae bacterium]
MKKNATNLFQIVIFLLLGGAFLAGVSAIASNGEGAGELEPRAILSEISVTAVTSEGAAGDDPSQQATPLPTIDIANVPVIEETALEPALNPIMNIGQEPTHNFQIYEVERGDTPNRIADRFGINSETLLGGNPWLSQESSLLQAGVELTILPIDGVLHEVQVGDTLEGIAELYGIPVDDIIAYEPNNLEFPFRLYKGTQILVPGAVRELFIWTPPKLPDRPEGYIVGTGTFVRPVGGGCVSQYYWPGHPGLDIALGEGSAVYAMDTGTVTYASWASGSYYDYGNLIVVNHGNGYETFYAHLSGINVFPGQVVNQGQVIGATGNTGRSSGPHIHVEIRLGNFRDDPSFYIGIPGGC